MAIHPLCEIETHESCHGLGSCSDVWRKTPLSQVVELHQYSFGVLPPTCCQMPICKPYHEKCVLAQIFDVPEFFLKLPANLYCLVQCFVAIDTKTKAESVAQPPPVFDRRILANKLPRKCNGMSTVSQRTTGLTYIVSEMI